MSVATVIYRSEFCKYVDMKTQIESRHLCFDKNQCSLLHLAGLHVLGPQASSIFRRSVNLLKLQSVHMTQDTNHKTS